MLKINKTSKKNLMDSENSLSIQNLQENFDVDYEVNNKNSIQEYPINFIYLFF
jgi:hypothetical protein